MLHRTLLSGLTQQVIRFRFRGQVGLKHLINLINEEIIWKLFYITILYLSDIKTCLIKKVYVATTEKNKKLL